MFAVSICLLPAKATAQPQPRHLGSLQKDETSNDNDDNEHSTAIARAIKQAKMTDIPASTTKRLLRELKEYSKAPNDALLSLAPVSDDDLLHWEAVLKGVPDSPYEGTASNLCSTGC